MSRLPFRKPSCHLRRAQEETAAFGDFYDAYSRRVLRFFAKRVVDPEAAFDLTSETFAKALARKHQFRGRTTEEEQGWLFAIARNELSHFWRRGTVERAALAKLGVAVPALSSDDYERIEKLAGYAELAPQIANCVESLPADQQEAVRMRVVEEMDYSEVATALGVTEQVARSKVSRGLRKLGRLMAERDPAGLDAVLEETT